MHPVVILHSPPPLQFASAQGTLAIVLSWCCVIVGGLHRTVTLSRSIRHNINSGEDRQRRIRHTKQSADLFFNKGRILLSMCCWNPSDPSDILLPRFSCGERPHKETKTEKKNIDFFFFCLHPIAAGFFRSPPFHASPSPFCCPPCPYDLTQ